MSHKRVYLEKKIMTWLLKSSNPKENKTKAKLKYNFVSLLLFWALRSHVKCQLSQRVGHRQHITMYFYPEFVLKMELEQKPQYFDFCFVCQVVKKIQNPWIKVYIYIYINMRNLFIYMKFSSSDQLVRVSALYPWHEMKSTLIHFIQHSKHTKHTKPTKYYKYSWG